MLSPAFVSQSVSDPFLAPGIKLTTPVIINMSAQKSEFEELFQHISDPALVLDTAGKRVYACNNAFATLAIRPCAAITSMDLADLLHFDKGDPVSIDGHERATLM